MSREIALSLTIILGNEEPIIARFLDSFRPLMDELCVVMAPGAKEPDHTEEIVRLFCANHDIPLNLIQHQNREEWPHVDSFGWAREQSRRLASGRWCMWADADDLFSGTREQVDRILREADESGAEMVGIVYDVANMDRRFPRERFWRRELCRWSRPVHEQITPTTATKLRICVGPDDPVIVHAPVGDRSNNRDRNLRILGRLIEEATPAHFYRAWDLLLCGKTDDAIREYRKSLAVDDDEQRRFATFCQLAMHDQDRASAIDAAFEAARIYPDRREGYGLAATLFLRGNDPRRALALLTAASAQPGMRMPDWTTMPEWYGPRVDELTCSCLRLLGAEKHADDRDRDRFLAAGGRLSLLIEARDEGAIHLREGWLMAAKDRAGVEVVLYGEPTDKTAAEWDRITKPYRRVKGGLREAVAAAHGTHVCDVTDTPPCSRGFDKEDRPMLGAAVIWTKAEAVRVAEQLSNLARVEYGHIRNYSEPHSCVLWPTFDMPDGARKAEIEACRRVIDGVIQSPYMPWTSATYFDDNARRNIGDVLREHSQFDVLIIGNADIMLSSPHIRPVDWLCMPPGTALCISRDDMHGRHDSQDLWAFRLGGPELPPLKFPLGKPGCDNRLAGELIEAGWTVLNPVNFIGAPKHLHADPSTRTYTAADVIPGPYVLVPPARYLSTCGRFQHPQPYWAELQPDGRWKALYPAQPAVDDSVKGELIPLSPEQCKTLTT